MTPAMDVGAVLQEPCLGEEKSVDSFNGRWRKGVALTLLVIGAACGSQVPTGPGTTTPPPVTPPPPPAIQLDWASLARLFDDPLFRQLPQLLDNQVAATPLNGAVQNLISGIHARNYDVTRGALLDLAGARQTYGLGTSSVQADRMLLVAISLFEMRGWGYINKATAAVDVPEASVVDETAIEEAGQ